MDSPTGRALICVALLTVGVSTAADEDACGWPGPVQDRVIADAKKMMPPALQRLLKRHHRALQEGVRRARSAGQAGIDTHTQGPLQTDGSAARLAESIARTTALINGHAPMAEVAREMGVTAHLVGDLSDPFRAAPDDTEAARHHEHFRRYLARMLPDLRVVFEGYGAPELHSGQPLLFGEALAAQARSYLDDLIGIYRRNESHPDPRLFDQRSIPFGVASLTYSRTVTDTARAWLHAWRAANGDITGLPFPLEENAHERDQATPRAGQCF